jgi:hypothetical protein
MNQEIQSLELEWIARNEECKIARENVRFRVWANNNKFKQFAEGKGPGPTKTELELVESLQSLEDEAQRQCDSVIGRLQAVLKKG